jgi:holo-[acyl-carrier protein] synthase
MQISIGTDIVSISRFREFARDRFHPALRKMFTPAELDYCFSKDDVEVHLAARFAGKEAIIKALYSRNIDRVWYTDIEITNNDKGVPSVRIKKETFSSLKLLISLAHCEDMATAYALIIGDDYQ